MLGLLRRGLQKSLLRTLSSQPAPSRQGVQRTALKQVARTTETASRGASDKSAQLSLDASAQVTQSPAQREYVPTERILLWASVWLLGGISVVEWFEEESYERTEEAKRTEYRLKDERDFATFLAARTRQRLLDRAHDGVVQVMGARRSERKEQLLAWVDDCSPKWDDPAPKED